MTDIELSLERLRVIDEIIKAVRYRPSDAYLVAHDGRYNGLDNTCAFPDKTAVLLFRGRAGHYFEVHLSDWKDEHDTVVPLSVGEAMESYRRMSAKFLTWSEAFPHVEVKEA